MYTPGKSLVEIVRSASKGKKIDRRTAIIGGIEWIALIGALGYNALKSRKPSFNEVLERIKSKYPISHYKKLGPKIIFYIEDIHYKEKSRENIQKIDFLEREFNVQLVGLEGFLGCPGSDAEKRLTQRWDSVLKIDQDKVWYPKRSQDSQEIYTEDRGDYKDVFKDKRFKVVGLEPEELAFKGALASDAEDIYDLLINGSMQGYVPVEVRGKPLVQVYTLIKIQEAINDPNFPKFDLNKIPEKEEIRILHNSEEYGSEHLAECAFNFQKWMVDNVIDPRTKSAIQGIEKNMGDLDRGVIVFGRGHGRGSPYRGIKTTIQDELEKKGFSYITLSLE